jgi:four helix bundle protein
MFRFEELEIWKSAIEYGNEIYDLTQKMPSYEAGNLIDQIRRAALSVSNNIAEGSGTATKRNFCSFLDISVSSALETVNLLHFAKRRNYISELAFKELYNKVEVLIKRIRAFKSSLKV